MNRNSEPTIKSYSDAKAYLNGKSSEKLAGRDTRLVETSYQTKPAQRVWSYGVWVYLEPEYVDAIAVEYHWTKVVTYLEDGRVVINSGGYHTLTTKRRINQYSYAYVYQKNWNWFFGDDGSPFKDGEIFGESNKLYAEPIA